MRNELTDSLFEYAVRLELLLLMSSEEAGDVAQRLSELEALEDEDGTDLSDFVKKLPPTIRSFIGSAPRVVPGCDDVRDARALASGAIQEAEAILFAAEARAEPGSHVEAPGSEAEGTGVADAESRKRKAAVHRQDDEM